MFTWSCFWSSLPCLGISTQVLVTAGGAQLSSSPSYLLPLSAPKASLRCSVSHGLQFKCLNGSLDVIKAICVLGVQYVLKHLAGWSHKSARASTEQ